jgi:adenylate cyclase
MPEDRRLAAIMFTDIVGYTALMGSDEDNAFQLLRKNRDLQRPLIKKYRGEWLKEMGDGILASFHTASDAVRCAGEIQHEAKKVGIPLRIGIHEGEVVFEGGDVLGDGVNIASRLQESAEEGCITISGSVYRDIKNKKGIKAEFIEEGI